MFVIDALGRFGTTVGLTAPFIFGIPGDTPFVGDFDGDGIDTVGLYRASTGLVYLRDSLTEGAADHSFALGSPDGATDGVIMAGDWDGDGDDTMAVYRPSMQRVYLYLENSARLPDYSLYVGSHPVATTWSREFTPQPTQWLDVRGIFAIAPN